MMDAIMNEYSFDAHKYKGSTITITKPYVRAKLSDMMRGWDMRRSLI